MSFRLLTLCSVTAALAVGVYLWRGEYTRKAHVTGLLVPEQGVIRLVPPRDAVVLERHAREGARVRQGDLLFVLSLEPASPRGEQVRRSLELQASSLDASRRHNADLLREQAAALDRRLVDMQAERVQLQAEAQVQRDRLALAQRSLERLEALQGDNFVSSAHVQNKAEDVFGIRAQLQALERQQAVHERELTSLAAQRRQLPLQAESQQDELSRQQADLAQRAAESESRRRVEIRAPQDGVLGIVSAAVGQAVTPAAALASVVPADGHLLAQLYAPSSAIGFVQADQTVLLRYQAFPFQQFGHQAGRVVQVSLTPLPPAEQAALAGRIGSPSEAQEPLYRITVALPAQQIDARGQARPLRAGMQLDADVLLERRRLVDWLIGPIQQVAGRG